MLKRLIVLFFPLILLSGCAKRIELQTYADMDSIPTGFPKGASFFIFTDPHNDPLLAKEAAKKIAFILKSKGYSTADKYSAQYYLYYNYGLNAEKYIVQVPMPVSHTSVSTSGQSYSYGHGNSYGTYNGNMYGDVVGQFNGNYNSQATYSGTTQYSGQTVATQTALVPRELIAFNKAIVLQVFDASVYRSSEKEQKIWQSIACNFDQDGNLRSALDFLLLASFEYFGKNTSNFIEFSIKNNDKNINVLRNTYLQTYVVKPSTSRANIPEDNKPQKFNVFIEKFKKECKQFGTKVKNYCTKKKKLTRHARSRKKRGI